MELSDCLGDTTCIENYIPSPRILQKKHRHLSSTILNGAIQARSASERVAWLSLTRFGLQNNKIVVLEALISELKKLDNVHLTLHKNNRQLGNYIKINIPDIRVEYSKGDYNYWRNGLSKGRETTFLELFIFFVCCFVGLLCSFVIGWFWIGKKMDLEWMNFANNKDTVDLPLIDRLRQRGVRVGSPVFIPVVKRNTFYFFSSRQYNLLELTKFLYHLSFRSSQFFENTLIKVNEESNLNYPIKFPLCKRSKLLLIHQYLYSNYTNSIKSTCLFRGGNASGIWHEALFTQRKTILLTHGTEFNIIDHEIYKYLDLNLLPSAGIVQKWLDEDRKINPEKLRGCGRPYYESLRLRVKKSNFGEGPIGIVLTYSSDARTYSFIMDILKLARKFNRSAIIKTRTNFTNDLTPFDDVEDVEVWKGDIYSFLSKISLCVAGVSDYGVLGMTVTDGISLGIPSIYFTQGVDAEECGYSYSKEMSGFVFKEISTLLSYSANYSRYEDLLRDIFQANATIRQQLGPNEGVFDHVCELIENECK